VTKAASLRTIFDLSDLDKSQFIYQTGQSGWVNSRNYGNYADTWAKQGYIQLTMKPNTIIHTATLISNQNKKPEHVKIIEKKK
jgi:penicillin amidase